MVEHPSPKPHALYRFFGDGGQLLYVGITNNPSGRFHKHGQTKSWWPDVRGITVEWYDDRPTVLAAETRAIHVENPLHNVQRPALPVMAIVPDDEPSNDDALTIEWNCAWCGYEVEDGDGHMYVNAEELFEARHASRNDDDEDPVALWGPNPYREPAYWRVSHVWCGPDPQHDDSAYALEIHKLRTYPKVLWWTAHLSGKTWLEDTNWMTILRRLADNAGGES